MAAAFVHVQHDAFPEVLCSLNKHGILVTHTHTPAALHSLVPAATPLTGPATMQQTGKTFSTVLLAFSTPTCGVSAW